MSDVEFRDSDFTEAVSQLRQAGDVPLDATCPAFGIVRSGIVESALGTADSVVRTAMSALGGAADDLATDTSTVHTELLRTDAALAGGAG